MALVKSGSFGSSPSCAYELHAQQISGDGNWRTIRITLKLKVNGSTSQSRYGFPLNWKGRVIGNYSNWLKVKGSEYWYGGEGWRSYTFETGVDTGTTAAKGITVGFQLDYPSGSSSWETTQTATFTTSATTPPKPDAVTGVHVSGLFEEGETQTITWNPAPRADFYKVWYKVWQLPNGGWSRWLQHGGDIYGTSYSLQHNGVGRNKYGAIFYCITAYNGGGSSPDSNSATTEHYGVRVWNGSGWSWGQMRVWNGSGWTKVIPQVWDGAGWVYS